MISQCIQQMAMKILKENPNIANNPNAQSMINVIQSGDEKKGQEIAENICKSMGVSKEDKERMEQHGEEHVEKAIVSMRDIWSEASPELKRRMKTELSTLVDSMSI